MTENLKKLSELASADEALAKRAILEQGSEALSDDELDAVTGGDNCLCALGGGGVSTSTGTSSRYADAQSQDLTCGCAGYGEGKARSIVRELGTNKMKEIFDVRCRCPVGGHGETFVKGKKGWI